MKGMFGGIIELINWCGGAILLCLLGKVAWTESRLGRILRIGFGSIGIGIVISLIVMDSWNMQYFMDYMEHARGKNDLISCARSGDLARWVSEEYTERFLKNCLTYLEISVIILVAAFSLEALKNALERFESKKK